MKKFFMQLPLPRKLILIAVIPLICLLYFGFTVFKKQNEDINTIDRLADRVINATAIMKVADEIHMERRNSVNYVLQTGSLNDLLTQRAKTDLAIDAVKSRLLASDTRFFQYSLLNTLPKKRNEIDSKSMPQRQVLDYYSNLIFRLNDLANVNVPDLPVLSPIQKDMNAQYLLAQMAAYQGMIRMDIYYFMLKKEVWPEDFARIENNNDMVNSFRAEFLDKASPELVKDFQRMENSNEVRITSDFIKSTIQTRKIDTLFNADSWWSISTQSVDQLKQLQRTITDKVSKDTRVLSKQENDIKTKYLVALVLIVVLVITFLAITIKSIADSLELLRSAAVNVARGIPSSIPDVINTKDALGSLVRSFVLIDQNNQDLATAADSIGKGNFNIDVKPRSSEDVLGIAVVQMAADLKAFRYNNDQKIWIQTGLNRISETLLGEKDLNTLSDNALTDLIQYAGAQTGVLYIKQSGILTLSAGYALSPDHPAPETIEIGKTLLGQSMVQKEPLYLQETPDDFLHIAGATSGSKPGYVLIVPLVHAGIAEGVIEIASLYPFREAAVDFVKQAAVNIAIAIQSTRSRTRLQELLEETQAQAEELQTQHSELESLNVELEAQAQRLQVSEEELKVQQEELMQSNSVLEERSRMLEEKNQIIVERNLEIQRKAEELELSTRYKSEFLANMSHELRTPLNSILLLSRLLAENHDKNLTNDQIEYADVINNSGKGLLTLIDEILDLSKIESGKMELEYMQVSVATICNNMQSLFEHIAREKGLQLLIDIHGDVPSAIETDQTRLEQILKNLLSNALKFTARGSVKLVVERAAAAGAIKFTVRDTGIGIPEDKQQVIFEAFQQADGSTRRKYGGTGLGLSISRELAKLLGGGITVSSEPNKGSEFTVTVPVSRDATPASTVAQASPEEKTKEEGTSRFVVPEIPASVEDDRGIVRNDDRVILIVEDDTNFAKALLDFTRKRGYKGIVSVRGDEATELARIYKPVGILLDIQLPVKDGWQVMEELKSDPRTRPIPVHIMSSLEARKESLMKGAVDFISKPVDLESMALVFEKLEFVLQRSTKKVLILEENTKHAKALAYFLSNYQVNSEISSSVNDGIGLLQQKDVDCVILDMGIPDQKAYEALETVKEIKGLENLPIIIFTGKSLSKSEEQRIRQYADSIVVKTAHSYQRMLDEVSLFLHLVSEQAPAASQPNNKMGMLNEVLKDKTVLIADDDVRNIFSLTKALERHQMKVLSAIDGKEALQQLKENQVDIVLMDMMMPEMDGYDAIAAIRKQAPYKNLPIIAVTAKAMMGDREKCLQAGASDYISKPVDVDQLLSLLRVWLYDKSMK
ncbi:Signal transduction histidine kinase [Chitinophaga terrae (ex Kim and Jung 2007)]|uniref:histidine kinase n=1 Tax=Chitinophaga terrae (ex Kim and Jung 2007) TaxID=408074 RepID=A0A1H3YA50_9BACT|nr:response regulator [Chitinophaga terrae (ex Kim and Jung 2007)]GEP90881.1 histidine kinase [Chitinophaga terrae (ex Kim and Jung 2007)]SEA07812.1 Signal transduction histidine kinase [Chitinophaga terrae (ex Kim and Jung 2007)]